MKMNFVIVLILLLLESCWSDIDDTDKNCTSDCTIISGMILTEGGTVPASGLNFQLDWEITSELGGTYRNIKKFQSDKNGYFEFSFHATDQELHWGGGYSIRYLDSTKYFVNLKDNYNDFPEIGVVNLNKRDTLINKILWIPRLSYLKLRILNPNVQTSCMVYYNYGDVTSDRINSPGIWTYSNEQPEKIVEAAGNQINYIRIYKEINNETVSNVDSIYVPINDTVIYSVK
jgi:hypothetical protein